MTLDTTFPLPSTWWAIEPDHGQHMADVLSGVDWVAHAQEWQGKTTGSAAAGKPAYRVEGGVAIIALDGPLTKKPHSMQALVGGTSTLETIQALRAALADSSVEAILMLTDSPGGEVAGTGDLAAMVTRAAQKKPVWAYIDGMGASAGYWPIAGATRIIANSQAIVGSIGIYRAIEDSSEQAERAGRKIRLVKAGKFKGTGEPGVPITEEQIAEVQRTVDAFYSQFKEAVATGRGLTQEEVDALADGSVHVGPAAVERKLVDEVASLEATLHHLKRVNAHLPKAPIRGKENNVMRDKLAAALARVGMGKFAASILSAQSDDAEVLANHIATNAAEEMASQVSAQVAAHPLLAAAAAAGVTTPEQFNALKAHADNGKAWGAQVSDQLKAEAVRLFGAEVGQQRASSMQHLPAADQKAIADEWGAQADEKFGVGKAMGASRQTTPDAASAGENEAGAKSAAIDNDQVYASRRKAAAGH